MPLGTTFVRSVPPYLGSTESAWTIIRYRVIDHVKVANGRNGWRWAEKLEALSYFKKPVVVYELRPETIWKLCSKGVGS